MGMLEVTCVPAIMEETLIREYTVNLPTHSQSMLGFGQRHKLLHRTVTKKKKGNGDRAGAWSLVPVDVSSLPFSPSRKKREKEIGEETNRQVQDMTRQLEHYLGHRRLTTSSLSFFHRMRGEERMRKW